MHPASARLSAGPVGERDVLPGQLDDDDGGFALHLGVAEDAVELVGPVAFEAVDLGAVGLGEVGGVGGEVHPGGFRVVEAGGLTGEAELSVAEDEDGDG